MEDRNAIKSRGRLHCSIKKAKKKGVDISIFRGSSWYLTIKKGLTEP